MPRGSPPGRVQSTSPVLSSTSAMRTVVRQDDTGNNPRAAILFGNFGLTPRNSTEAARSAEKSREKSDETQRLPVPKMPRMTPLRIVWADVEFRMPSNGDVSFARAVRVVRPVGVVAFSSRSYSA